MFDDEASADVPPALPPEFTELTTADWSDSGLLWKINHDILHPLGIALAITYAGDDGPPDKPHLTFLYDEEAWAFTPEVNDQRAAMFERWAAQCRPASTT